MTRLVLVEVYLKGNNFPFSFTMCPPVGVSARACGAEEQIDEAIRWCADNFGEQPQGAPVAVHRYLAWKARFRFRTKTDAAAFKLRWG